MRVWKHQPQVQALAPVLHEWFETDLGQAVLAAERRLIEPSLTNCFGYHLLQLGIDGDQSFFRDCRVQRCFKAGPVLPQSTSEQSAPFVQCNFEELPFDTDSLDVVVAHHVVEFASDPYAMLRELYRVTVPEGRVVLIGFNPWSLLGARMVMGRLKDSSVWRNHWLSAARMLDWLQLLGFAVQDTKYGFHQLPLHRTARWGESDATWAHHLPGGGIYMITALKQVAKFIPTRPLRARPVRVLAPLPVAKPSTAIGQRRGRSR
ncbi:MAG TPA: class I SAM-dependent methyltransferase [Spongiibacteraceae bacterium]|nr:class I SAM-dependent methyltransferase [Spongiibacteraceae bacterium]